MIKTLKIPHVVAQLYRVPHGILQVFIIILYEYVFPNPELFRTQISLSDKQSTLGKDITNLRVSVGLLEATEHDLIKSVDSLSQLVDNQVDTLNDKVELLNTTSKDEHKVIHGLIQNTEDTVVDINLTKTPIGSIMAWISRVDIKRLNVSDDITLPLGIP
jgi:hypothetical protein